MLPLGMTTRPASPFWFLYSFCGITDMADGIVARKLKTATKTGALLDSIADIVFVVCCSFKLTPILELPSWLWGLVLMIVGIKIANQISAMIVHKRSLLPHTTANKLTGLLLFISIPLFVCFGMFQPLTLTSVVAAFAAIQEGHYIRTK